MDTDTDTAAARSTAPGAGRIIVNYLQKKLKKKNQVIILLFILKTYPVCFTI